MITSVHFVGLGIPQLKALFQEIFGQPTCEFADKKVTPSSCAVVALLLAVYLLGLQSTLDLNMDVCMGDCYSK